MECIGTLEMQNRRERILKFARCLIRHSGISAINIVGGCVKVCFETHMVMGLTYVLFKSYLIGMTDKEILKLISVDITGKLKVCHNNRKVHSFFRLAFSRHFGPIQKL